MLRKIILGVSLFLATNIIWGCAALPFFPFMGPAYDGYSSWRGRTAIKYYLADIDKIQQAIIRSSQQMNLETIQKSVSDNGKGYSLEIKGKNHLQIEILPYEENITKVSIKIPLFGDKQFATFFYQTIDASLYKKGD